MNINIDNYDLFGIDDIKIKNNIENNNFYDIEVEDNVFFIVNDENYILTHNCDGSHIKGLILNFFACYFKELLLPEMNFLFEFITPIIKASNGKDVKYFYKLDDYKKWKKNSNSKLYRIKYFKGLGTLEPYEAKMFFKDLNKHLIKIGNDNVDVSLDIIDLLFRQKRANDRKEWLLNYKPDIIVDKFSEKTTIKSFFEKEFIEFSMYDNIRSIPSIMDGLKPSQRKILYSCFKNNLKNDTKVNNLTGKIISDTAYHHGPISLEQAIISMAQHFVGSNNLNLLEPVGQFGTRLYGGKDAASSRYIFTKLSDITHYIYRKEDEDILDYLDDDGYPIEPRFFLPIIPMMLINKCAGIGTGWSVDIPQYNIKDVIKYLGCKLKDVKINTLHPHYNKFKGELLWDKENERYITRGIITKVNMSTIRISELPIGVWNEDYYTYLDALIDDKVIKDYTKNDTDEDVDILINIEREKLKEIEDAGTFYKVFNLDSYISIKNMHLFNHDGKIKKYNSVYEILDEFYDVRLTYYQKRKDYILDKLAHDRMILINKMKFINHILKGELKINNVKRDIIEKGLEELELVRIEESYNYLLNLSIVSLTSEKLQEFKEIFQRKKEEIKVLEETSIKKMWMDDLAELFKKLK